MKEEDLIDADKWMCLHNYATYIDKENKTLFIDLCDFEFELSSEEILYRARCYRDYIRNKY